ncbi:MAG: pseudouridine synthase [Acidimicrobiales bacterium]|nr:pseudouridine synthase [Acidimicrobiales bacterium]
MASTTRTVLAFWKPYDVLSTFTDRDGRDNLSNYVDLVGAYGAGRLDKDSEGLLIVTDDAALRSRLTEPKRKVPKSYYVQVEGIPDDAALDALRTGVELKDGLTRPAKATRMKGEPELPARPVPIRSRAAIPTSWLRLTITEGRNRQVRRMTAAVGYPTLRLVRWSVGGLNLAGLSPGEYRVLDESEIAKLTG